MVLENVQGYAFYIGKSTDPTPALTASNVRFVPSDLPTRAECQAWLRANPGAVTYPVSQISNVQVTGTTGGGLIDSSNMTLDEYMGSDPVYGEPSPRHVMIDLSFFDPRISALINGERNVWDASSNYEPAAGNKIRYKLNLFMGWEISTMPQGQYFVRNGMVTQLVKYEVPNDVGRQGWSANSVRNATQTWFYEL
ncbi:hypothetical protein [Fibrella forsythiae]|uniref:Uncharacterized protein n=1 Tax=Fibrella forsythiae TaxID=2817061 RepID=A0ABS3JCT3_9BACT|nr:hypothetical protein [Fibrella forsythiae]MBO0947248.1 hypothetical protein [Fibrella forsythiae]